MTKEEAILRVIKPYASVFPNSSKMQAEAWPIYARALSSLPVEAVSAAMAKLMQTAKFFPTIAEIFEAARSVSEYANGTALPTAAEAWEEVMRLVDKCHLYEEWTYSCPEVKRAAECMGKYELCMMLESEVGVYRGQFVKMYNEICKRRRDDAENEAVLTALPKVREALLAGKIAQIAEAKRL